VVLVDVEKGALVGIIVEGTTGGFVLADGVGVGAGETAMEGPCVGDLLGATDGELDGAADGDTVGAPDGDKVLMVVRVGACVAFAEGWGVMACVGVVVAAGGAAGFSVGKYVAMY